MAQSRKKRQIDGRLEILQNCDRGTIESILPMFLTFIWDVEQYMRVEDSFLKPPYFANWDQYFNEKKARKKEVLNHLKTFYKLFCDDGVKVPARYFEPARKAAEIAQPAKKRGQLAEKAISKPVKTRKKKNG